MRCTIFVVIAILLISPLAACTQAAAPVAMKGSEYYGREGGGTVQSAYNHMEWAGTHYGAARQIVTETNSGFIPSYNETQYTEPAQLSSVSVQELAPISVSDARPLSTPAYSAPAPAPVVVASTPAPAYLKPQDFSSVTPASAVSTTVASNAGNNPSFVWPAEGEVISHFGPKPKGLYNDGINIRADEGEPIYAAEDGTVIYAGNELKGYGNMALVRHANGWVSAYSHAADIIVQKNDKVNRGQVIGYVGKTGSVESAQLHFSIRDGKNPLDPEQYLSHSVASR